MWLILISLVPYRTTWWGTRARAHGRFPFPYLGNDWTDCAEISCVVIGPLDMRFTQDGGYLLHRTYNGTHISAHVFASARSSPKRRFTGYIPRWAPCLKDCKTNCARTMYDPPKIRLISKEYSEVCMPFSTSKECSKHSATE